jgi:hypothetical protein
MLARLSLVCKQLYRIYAPLSTWRHLFIEAKCPRSARHQKLELSPSLARVLKHPETGFYAKELVIQYKGFWKNGFVGAFENGTMVDFDRFLANTPRLETVRCINNHTLGAHGLRNNCTDDARFPIQLLASLSSLASLRYLFLGEFDMDFEISPSLPPLHQVRILRYSPAYGPNIVGDLLRFSMPNIHSLYVTANRLKGFDDEEDDALNVITAIEVRYRLLRLLLFLSLSYEILFGASISQTPTG